VLTKGQVVGGVGVGKGGGLTNVLAYLVQITKLGK